MSRKVLYRRFGSAVIAILATITVAMPRIVAQQDKPQLKRPTQLPQEKPAEPKKKKEKGPRAVGILQMSSGGKATLIPVAILIGDRFYDASAYKAEPVPMALDSGTVYEVEQGGESQGLFTISAALHSKNPGNANPWVGTGSYLPHGAEAPEKAHRAEDVPIGLDNSGDEPPRLTRGKGAKDGAADSSASQAGAGAGKTAGGESTGPATTSGQDAKKSAPPEDKSSDPAAKQQAPGEQKSSDQAKQDQTKQDQAKQDQTKQDQAKQDQTSQNQTNQNQTNQNPGHSDQGAAAENYYRPTLRRGKPTETAPKEEDVSPRPAAASPTAAGGASGTTTVQLVPAISDAGGPEPQSYKFYWKEGEEDERRKQMLALAADEVRAYVTARVKGEIPAKPASKTGVASRKSAAKPAEPVFEKVLFRGFDVWKNNQPVMILSAEAHFAPKATTGAAPEIYSITLVTRTDIYGNLRKLYAGVTDKFHLDVTPRLELVDVVDADGDGRGELLFRETADAGNGYVIYRATGDKLWKMFDSLGGE